MDLKDLEVYKLACELSEEAWKIYKNLDWQDKKTMGDQFITSADSVAANIAEGFGRFHYLDRNKFNYNSRGSLYECLHWLELLEKRGKISKETFLKLDKLSRNLAVKLNNYISATLKKRYNDNS